MSAWLCTARHISCVVNAVGHREFPYAVTRDKAFVTLARQNAASVDYRYEETDSSKEVKRRSYRYDPEARVEPIAALKAIHCLRYQSCETPDYETSEAAMLLTRIEGALLSELPGYKDAPWGIDDRPALAMVRA